MYYVPVLDRNRRTTPKWVEGPLFIVCLLFLVLTLPISVLYFLKLGTVKRGLRVRVFSWLGVFTVYALATLWLVSRLRTDSANAIDSIVVIVLFGAGIEMLKSLKVYWKEFQHERNRPPMWYR
jgi:hypothetical protein